MVILPVPRPLYFRALSTAPRISPAWDICIFRGKCKAVWLMLLQSLLLLLQNVVLCCLTSPVGKLTTNSIHLRTYYRVTTVLNSNQYDLRNGNIHKCTSGPCARLSTGHNLVSLGCGQQSFIRHSSTVGSVDAAAAIIPDGATSVCYAWDVESLNSNKVWCAIL